ncbi:MAG: hypothetical protein D6705_07220 [Deltaproteobacteria bacterium]|nr:MAG: hypothetical protein D6705_07220 [Deltaproteobacteria bacterium]
MWRRLARRRFQLPRFEPYVPRATDPKTFWLDTERDDLVEEVVRRIVARHGGDPEAVEAVLSDAVYHEIQRLEAQHDEESRARLGDWRELVRALPTLSFDRRVQTLEDRTRRMAYDVAGNFDPRVYRFAAKVVPTVLASVMHPGSLLPTEGSLDPELRSLVVAQGDIERLRRISEVATVVYVPTHASNLDSLALAWALYREGLPPVVYGAGKNLFTNPIISFFMHNLGAYRIDRRIRAQLYKDVLKTYSAVLLERGYHSLFFPGGTRSRSGEVEKKLKLGLAGTAVEAFARNAVRGRTRPMVFVPTTINYTLVLEAETLISDYLHQQGRSRYIIDDDEFSRIDRWVAFFHRLREHEGACILRFAEPIDPFGNPVDAEGRSIGPGGRVLDPTRYLRFEGSLTLDHEREHAYTEALGADFVRAFHENTVVMPSQAVAHVLYRWLVRATPGVEPFARLRRKGELAVPRSEVTAALGRLRDRLLELEAKGALRVSPWLASASPDRVIDRVLAEWAGYHLTTIAAQRDGAIVAEDPRLLLYYGNRLRPWALELAEPGEERVARELLAEVWEA